jgi:hypothetical protein
MNNDRRKRLRALQTFLDTMPLWDDFTSDLQTLIDEEQEAFDNLPESLQSSERGEKMQAAIDCMQAVVDATESIDIPTLEDAIEA